MGVGEQIKVYGNAQKFTVGPNNPFEIAGHTSYRDRPIYEGILNQIILDYKVDNPKNVTVWFDMNTLDYSLPQIKGFKGNMRINTLQDGFETPKPFVEYAASIGVSTLTDFREGL